MIYLNTHILSKYIVNKSTLSSINNHVPAIITSNSPLIFKILNKVDNCLLLFILSSTIISLFPKNVLSIPSIVEKIGWKLCLPSSLALSILSNESLQVVNIPKLNEDKNKYSVKILAPSVVIAFILGLLGSCIGGFLSYLIVSSQHIVLVGQQQQHLLQHFIPNFAACSACLASSYIGGTVNFFETADHLALLPSDMDVLKQLAAADIGVMIAYFSVLNMIKSFTLKNDNKVTNTSISNNTISASELSSKSNSIKVSKKLKLLYFTIASVSSILLSVTTNMIQDHFLKIPGISIMLLTSLAVILARQLPNYIRHKENFNAFISSTKGIF